MGFVVVGCCCEKLVVEVGTVRKPRGKGVSAIVSRYQVTASEDCNRLRRFGVAYRFMKCIEQSEHNPYL
jgi:hypothetical protein